MGLVLDQQALVRLSNLAAAKPEKAKMVEAAVINMARILPSNKVFKISQSQYTSHFYFLKYYYSCNFNISRRGQLAGKLSDESLKQVMERVSQQTQRTTTVKFDRRRNNLDSDGEDY
uniref:SRP_SPB domain-containing protein n=1 Tax=Heterorhabditis bacteriophora TaxID=37862 RepID=A0A1I7WTB9_HETBA